MAGVLHTARQGGFRNTVVTTSPEVTSYLIEHATQAEPDPFTERLIAAAVEVRATQPDAPRPGHVLAEPLTDTQLRILRLLPTSTPMQIAATLFVSRNTVKTHRKAIYQKPGVASRSQAVERAVALQLL